MTALKEITKIVTMIVIKSVLWTTVLALVVAILYSPLHYVIDIILSLGSTVLILFWLALLATYLLNFRTINRSIDSYFRNDKVAVIFTSVLLLFWLAASVGQLAPAYTRSQADWGWLANALLLALVLIVISKFTRKDRTHNKPSSLILDDPNNISVDLTETQQMVYDRVSLVLKEATDASIALTGNWGVGKTKILNDLKRNNPDVLWFSFYPWAYTSEEALVKDFYLQLTKSIDDVLPRVSSHTSKVSNSVKRLIDGQVINGLLSAIANIFFDLTGKTDTPEDLIYERLEREDLRVVVVVDDLERVNSTEITNRTLQLVHHLRKRNIKGISFITAFEREAIVAALPSHIKGDERSVFVEKFFDIEILLPDPTSSDIKSQLEKTIPRQLAPDYIRQTLLRDLRSHRAVTRLANEYQLANSVKGIDTALNNIVNMDDFIVLTHIKIKYPFVYGDISQNRHIYTQYAYGIDEEAIVYRMMDSDDEQNKFKADHLEAMFSRSGLSKASEDRIRKMLADVFPDASKALGEYGSGSRGADTQRRERRIGLRTVLDATLGTFDNLAAIIDHEMEVKRIIDTLLKNHKEIEITKAVDRFMRYAISLGHDKWDAPLYILTSEVSEKEESLRNDIPELTRALLAYALQLGAEHDDRFKVRLMGQAFHIFTDNLIYRGLPEDQKKEYVRQLSITKIVDSSQTPYGSLLFARLELSSEAKVIKGYLSDADVNNLRLKARRHFERYYIHEEHDMVLEAGELFYHLDDGWREIIGKYSLGKRTYNQWLSNIQRTHPSYFLDKYTTQTYRGTWAFKEEDFGTIKPVKDVGPEKLKMIVNLVDTIEGSEHLSEDDVARINMIREYNKTYIGKEYLND